jgi:DNA-directed RNA polymerase subunit M/transcription elongation factor TFIIS
MLSNSLLKNKILNEIKKIKISNFNLEKELLKKYSFVTSNSRDIKLKLILEAEKTIDRNEAINKLSKYVPYLFAKQIERGIFEFSLITVTFNKYQDYLIKAIYEDKLNDLCINLDTENKYINNQTLNENVSTGKIRSFFIAFLSPEQLHPKRWIDALNKQRLKEETINTLATTDLYKCYKCGERKCKISEMQIRSADEPSTKFITCLVCYNTFTK